MKRCARWFSTISRYVCRLYFCFCDKTVFVLLVYSVFLCILSAGTCPSLVQTKKKEYNKKWRSHLVPLRKSLENKFPAFNVNLCHRLMPFDWIGKRSNKSTSSHQFPEQTMCSTWPNESLAFHLWHRCSAGLLANAHRNTHRHTNLTEQHTDAIKCPWTFSCAKQNKHHLVNK